MPVVNKPPVINEIYCDDPEVDLYKWTTCHVVAYDPEGAPVSYLWVSDVPEMVNVNEQDAIYYANWGIGGGTIRVRITVFVSDEAEVVRESSHVSRAETYIDVRSLVTGR